MKKLLLDRCISCEHGVFGTMDFATEDAAAPALFTGEDEWRNNQARISCIPPGTYRLVPRHSPKFNRVLYEVTGVPGRGAILIHAGNTEENTEGCILVGLRLGFVRVKQDEELNAPNKKLAVLQSNAALDAFMTYMNNEEGELTVQWHTQPGASA